MKQYSPLERALEYIEEHLNDNIGLNEVSKETGYSYYYMTRLFTSVLGESVGRYINRRKLYNASRKLIDTDERVLDIAVDCGFASSEAFSRAFKSEFGSSPAEYRKAGADLVVNAKRELVPEDVYHIAHNISHSPEIIMTDETKVVGVRGTTSLSDNRIPEIWKQFLLFPKELFDGADVGYGICETKRAVYTRDGDVLFTVMAAGAVNTFESLPRTLERKILSAGKYAVFTHRGTFANLHRTYRYIFGTWLKTAGEELDDREDFEMYQRKIVSYDDPDNEVKIFIPIK